MGFSNTRFQGTYASIGANGDIRVKATKETPNAVYREYELSDGTKGDVYELIYNQVEGRITKVEFTDGNYGKVLNLHMTDSDGEDIILNLATSSNFAEDFMKKLPNVDFMNPVIIKPYAFTDEKTKKLKKGCTILQHGDQKVPNFFVEQLPEGSKEKPKMLHGFPAIEADKVYDKDDWKIYFMLVRKFLIEYVEKNVAPIIPENVVEVAPGVSVAGKEVEEAVEEAKNDAAFAAAEYSEALNS